MSLRLLTARPVRWTPGPPKVPGPDDRNSEMITPPVVLTGGADASKSKVFVLGSPSGSVPTVITKLSRLPMKLFHTASSRPATTRKPAPSALTTRAFGWAALMVRRGFTPVPGVAPPVPLSEYQHPFSAFQLCQTPVVGLP